MNINDLRGKKKEVVGIFPGLGSEHRGMLTHISNHSHAKDIIQVIDEVLGRRFIPVDRDNRERNQLDLQLSIFTVSLCYWHILSDKFNFIAFSGHSLGMYAALYAAGSLNLRDTVRFIVEAHRAVNELAGQSRWAMAAIIGLNSGECAELCSRIGGAYVSNVNAATQVVVSGKMCAIEKVKEEARALGALDIKDMGIPYPLHTAFLSGIRKRLEPLVDILCVKKPDVPVYDHSGAVYFARDGVRNFLLEQLERPVMWRDAVISISERFPARFLEVGPSDVLSRLVKWIIREAETLNAEKLLNCEEIGLV